MDQVPTAARNRQTRILVVEDDDAIQELVAMALEDEGYHADVAPHGAAALEIISQSPPDLVLLDMRMPVMDGWQFAEAYHAGPGPHAPIVVLTAGRDAAKAAAQIGAAGYLGKPFLLDDLLALVEALLAR